MILRRKKNVCFIILELSLCFDSVIMKCYQIKQYEIFLSLSSDPKHFT